MRITVLVLAVTVLHYASGNRAWAQEISTSADTALANSIAKANESQRTKDIEFLRTLTGKVKEQGYVSIPENSSLQSRVERLVQDKILGLTAAQRQRLVKNTIGEDDYAALVQVLLKQLGSLDINRQGSALRSLGYPLFALEATDQIKTFVFHEGRVAQLLALQTLVCLDVPGANRLLSNTLLRGIPMDYDAATAVRALYISNDKDLDRIALDVHKANPGGMVFYALLPVLKKRADYRQLVGELFKSNVFSVPDEEKLPLETLGSVHAENELLDEISSNPAFFLADEAIKKKVLMYAGTYRQFSLYTGALLILEKSGQDIKYFGDMQKDSQLPAEKKHVLEKIISRIQKGQRLK
jgi:hypothetical protein